MNKKEWFFPSSDNKTMIHAVEYVPSDINDIKGVVQIAHGCSENARIYEKLAVVLANHGYLVRANDHIGHGLSVTEGQKRISVLKAVKLYKDCGMKQVSYKLYDNCRHCIFQDYEHERVISDVVSWIDKVCMRKARTNNRKKIIKSEDGTCL